MREDKNFSLSDMRPSLSGFDQWTAGLLMLTNQIISLRMENGNMKVKHLEGPIFPMEVVEGRFRKFASSKRQSAIEHSQQKWADKNFPAVINA